MLRASLGRNTQAAMGALDNLWREAAHAVPGATVGGDLWTSYRFIRYMLEVFERSLPESPLAGPALAAIQAAEIAAVTRVNARRVMDEHGPLPDDTPLDYGE